jgi:hypothetical protein
LKTALVVSQFYLPFAKLEALMLKGLQMAGFRTVVLGNRRYEFLRYGWLAGNRVVLDWSDFGSKHDREWVDQQIGGLRSLQDWLDLEYEGVHVGRFAIATGLRRLKVGQLNFTDPSIQSILAEILNNSVQYTLAGVGVLQKTKPDCVLVMDRGYSGYGEIFDLAINRGIDTVTWHLGYKSNRLVVKRYSRDNERDHFLCPSTDSWRRLCSIPWNAKYGEEVRRELFHCYEDQDWMGFVGTQFDKQILSKEVTLRKLGLCAGRKVAVIFPHILWDGSFFSGKDLFDDYTQWLVETVRAACRNARLQWLVKLHPAHLVKAKQSNDPGRPSELDVIEKEVGGLPPHVKLIYPNTEISTYSLFEIADYTVTVRGTVGIESALFGIPVVTAGTGRYDRRGFTLDSATRQEYLQKLDTLETYQELSAKQIELAERYAYGVFFGRPLRLSSVSLEYQRDGKATPKFVVKCKTRHEWLNAPDMRRLAGWLADGSTEDMLELPPEMINENCNVRENSIADSVSA